jgi:Major Facilitator Superfamily
MVTADSAEAAIPRGLRTLLWGRAVSALGDGLWFTIWAVFFTRILGLSMILVGFGLAVAAGVGMAAAVPVGAIADRLNPRLVLVAITAIRAVAMASYLLVHDTVTFMVVTIPFTALATGGTAVRTALIAGLVLDNAARMRSLAQQRVAQHVGYAVGAGIGALVLAADRPVVYLVAIAGNAVTFVVLAATTLAVPRPAGPVHTAASRTALRDRPYLAVIGCTSLLSLCWAMLSTGLPLWISGSTHLPLALSGVVVVISSVGIAALQVPVTRLARTPGQAARTSVHAGIALSLACVLLATTSGAAGVIGTAVVIVAALLHVGGELGYVAATWGLSVNLMREDARGAYQGASEAATATVQMFAPAVFTVALGTFAAGGWLLVAALFLLVVIPVPALTRWAVRTRTPAGASR